MRDVLWVGRYMVRLSAPKERIPKHVAAHPQDVFPLSRIYCLVLICAYLHY